VPKIHAFGMNHRILQDLLFKYSLIAIWTYAGRTPAPGMGFMSDITTYRNIPSKNK
jgi:hypothetical protein